MALPTHPSDLLPPAPLEGNNAFASMELATQGMDSSFQFADEPPVMPGIDEIGHASQEPSILSPRDMDVDLEATTQVLDTLDALDAQFALDQSIMSPRPEEEVAPTSESALPPPDAAPAPEKEVVRVLPEWMTATKAPVVTRRSLYLHTQTRHRKKQEQVDSDSVWDSSLPYVDIMRPSEMCLDRVICFDVESTGFGKTDGIIEIGAVEYILGQRTGAIFQSYIKPSVPINTHAVDVHGITNHMLAAAPLAKLIIPSFLSWVGSAPLVAHNARFDMRMYDYLSPLPHRTYTILKHPD